MAVWHIPPMLLLPFIENACKHGVTDDKACPVQASLVAQTDILLFNVQNRKRQAEKDADGGIGIHNIRKRLELLYPGRHRLAISETEEAFSVHLEISN